jgi:hypothetical protein
VGCGQEAVAEQHGVDVAKLFALLLIDCGTSCVRVQQLDLLRIFEKTIMVSETIKNIFGQKKWKIKCRVIIVTLVFA